MSSALERFARRWWAGEVRGPARPLLVVLLAPLSWVWRATTAVRNARRDRSGGVSVDGVVVVSVGNLAVGGTGKTPVAAWVARHHQARGRRTAIVTGGYAADEELLHRRWAPDLIVVAGRDRTEATRRARVRGAEVVVLDDGFQHRCLDRSVDLVLLAAELPFPGPVMPLGPYREPAAALERATAVVVTRRTATETDARRLADRVEAGWPGRVKGCVRLVGGRWVDLRGRAREAPEGDVLAVAGVGRPEAFAETLRRLLPGRVELAPLRDHHDFTPTDVDRLVRRAGDRALVVTEKDAVKLAALSDADAWVLAQTVEWDWGDPAVVAALEAAMGRGVE